MILAALAASLARRSGEPLLAISPAARSSTAVDLPSCCARMSVPPAMSSISSGWAPIARMSTRVMAENLLVAECGDWVEFGCSLCGQHSEYEANADRHQHCHRRQP